MNKRTVIEIVIFGLIIGVSVIIGLTIYDWLSDFSEPLPSIAGLAVTIAIAWPAIRYFVRSKHRILTNTIDQKNETDMED